MSMPKGSPMVAPPWDAVTYGNLVHLYQYEIGYCPDAACD